MVRTKGKCAFCGREMTRGGFVRHLQACPEREAAIAEADAGPGKRRSLYHLQVQDAYSGDFWLHLEMDGSARLGDLDSYLRSIWLECCGHLSAFFAGGFWREEVSGSRRASQVFKPGLELYHIYDFGTSSETVIRVVDVRQGKPLTTHPIFLMARNNQPESICHLCGEPGTWLCTECMYEEDAAYVFCDKHARAHEHWVDMMLPIVNSPRTGMCGYTGPAEPPY
ncbi:MAG: hypothetical protein ACP5HG_08010 [Anaerolineae bacterium]